MRFFTENFFVFGNFSNFFYFSFLCTIIWSFSNIYHFYHCFLIFFCTFRSRKTHPGCIFHLSDCPIDSNKVTLAIYLYLLCSNISFIIMFFFSSHYRCYSCWSVTRVEVSSFGIYVINVPIFVMHIPKAYNRCHGIRKGDNSFVATMMAVSAHGT